MIPSNPIEQIFNYAGNAQYCNLPTPEQMSAGVVPLDSLPASWWNKMWADTTSRITEAREAVGIMINELCNVLVAAGICPQCNCLDQLYQSIDKIRKTLATATCPGAVVSSAEANKVAVAADGTMTVNCFGNAAALTTTAHTVVGAINELKSTYDNALTNMGNTVAGKAPISHASADATYGVGTASAYGHLKISDQYTSVLAACSGVAASQKAVADVYAYAANIAAGVSVLGNTVAVMDGTASAGTCNTAARSDHVHPWPNLSGSMWYHPDRWDGLVTAYQTDQAYCGTAAGWASYLTFTHSTVAAEYYQQIRFPFWSPPQVHRVEGGVDRGWQTIYTTENSCVGACANTGVVRDGNGFIYAGYLNTSNGRENPGDYPGYSLAFVDNSGWHRKADPGAIGVGWASNSGMLQNVGYGVQCYSYDPMCICIPELVGTGSDSLLAVRCCTCSIGCGMYLHWMCLDGNGIPSLNHNYLIYIMTYGEGNLMIPILLGSVDDGNWVHNRSSTWIDCCSCVQAPKPQGVYVYRLSC